MDLKLRFTSVCASQHHKVQQTVAAVHRPPAAVSGLQQHVDVLPPTASSPSQQLADRLLISFPPLRAICIWSVWSRDISPLNEVSDVQRSFALGEEQQVGGEDLSHPFPLLC